MSLVHTGHLQAESCCTCAGAALAASHAQCLDTHGPVLQLLMAVAASVLQQCGAPAEGFAAEGVQFGPPASTVAAVLY